MWLHVKWHCNAILHLLDKGVNGEIYHVAGEQELTNNELAYKILGILGVEDRFLDAKIEHIDDYNIRPGHDRRYALDVSKLKATGWKPEIDLDKELKDVIEWYKENKWWLR